jgi:UDP-N-acetylmuramoyl-tripeptide--D-alanyl-D-alanine ligase
VSLQLPDGELSFTLSQPGAHWVSNAAAVIAAVHALGGDLAAAGLALADMEAIDGRGARHTIAVAGGEALLIDEAYNANPTSMAATLDVFATVPADRRIAVLGAMGELGPESDALHAGLAPSVVGAGVDLALLVGSAMAPLAEALEGQCDVRHVPDAASGLEWLKEAIKPGDAILIKGSNAIGLGQIVLALKGGQN